MTTDTATRIDAGRECPETWLRRRLAAGLPAETWKAVPGWYYEQIRLPAPAVPHQVSDQGRLRNPKGGDLSSSPNGRPKELPADEQYRKINLATGGLKVTVPVHHVVLAAFSPEGRGDRETRHLGQGDANRAWNWWPEGITWGERRENAFDKPPEVRSAAAAKARAAQTEAGTAKPPRPVFGCRNHARCGGMVTNKGSRCAPCVVQVGRDAAVLLRLHMPSQAVGEHFGYTDGNWVHGLATEHGDYTGSKAEARTQRPTLRERIRITWIKRRMR